MLICHTSSGSRLFTERMWEWEVRGEITRDVLTPMDGSMKWEVRSPEIFSLLTSYLQTMKVRKSCWSHFSLLISIRCSEEVIFSHTKRWKWEVRSEITRDFFTAHFLPLAHESVKISGDLTYHFSLASHGMSPIEVRKSVVVSLLTSYFHPMVWESLRWSHFSLLTSISWCEKVSADVTSHFLLPSHGVQDFLVIAVFLCL